MGNREVQINWPHSQTQKIARTHTRTACLYWNVWHWHMWVHMLFIRAHREQTAWNNPQWQQRELTHLTTPRQMSSALSSTPAHYIWTRTSLKEDNNMHMKNCECVWKFVNAWNAYTDRQWNIDMINLNIIK